MRTRRAFMFAASCAALAVAACQIIAGVEDKEGVPRIDGGIGGLDAEAAAPADPCVKLQPPSRSTTATDGPDGPDIVFAVKNIYARPKGVAPFGFDLDGFCTGNPNSTTSEPSCTGGPNLTPDSDGGVDNALGSALDTFNVVGDASDPFGEPGRRNIREGRFTNLFGLFNYNGQANDSAIRVKFVISPGLTSTLCDGGGGPEAGPLWDGCDTWSHGPGVDDGPPVFWSDTLAGYVVDDVLVAHVEQMPFGLIFGEFNITDAVITARIERDANGNPTALTNGVVAGRSNATDAIRALQYIEFPTDEALCATELGFNYVRDNVCKTRDLALRAKDDGKGNRCEAVSFGIAFDARPARLGRMGVMPDASCPPRDPSCP